MEQNHSITQNIQNVDLSEIRRQQTTIESSEVEIETEVRKRLSENENASCLWTEFTLFERDNDNGEWTLSDIWCFPHPGTKRMAHTEKYKEMIKGDKQMMLKCNHCQECFPFYKNGSSPAAQEHLQNKHPSHYPFKKPQAKRPYGKVSSADEFTTKANVLLAAVMTSGKQSYNTASNSFLQDLLDHFQSSDTNYIIPSSDSFTQKIIPQMTQKVKEKIKEELNAVEMICATVDGWSKTIDSDSFLSFTIHYFHDGKIKGRVLKLSDRVDAKSADAVSKFINEVIEEYSLQRFVPFVVVTDNNAAVLKGVRDCGLIDIGCPCHRYELAVGDALDECEVFKRIVEKCKRISVMFKRSSTLQQALKGVQNEVYGLTLCVFVAVISRWFTNFDVMKRLYDDSTELESVVKAESLNLAEPLRKNFIDEHTFSNDEKNIMKFIIDALSMVVEKSNFLSSEKKPSLSFILHSHVTLLANLNKIEIIEKPESWINLPTFSVQTTSMTFESFSDFEQSGIDMSNIIEYTPQNKIFDMHEVKKEFIECLTKWLKFHFEEKNSFFDIAVTINLRTNFPEIKVHPNFPFS